MTSLSTQFMPGPSFDEPSLVYVTKAEYDVLIRISRQYANLCRNLRQGGVAENAITLLSTGDNFAEFPAPVSDNAQPRLHTRGTFSSQGISPNECLSGARRNQDLLNHRSHHGSSSSEQQGNDQGDWGDTEYDPSSEDLSLIPESSEGNVGSSHNSHSRELHRHAKRSIYISNLPSGATYGDIAAAICGGQLADFFLLHRDRAAIVAFLYGDDARDFYHHFHKHDLYVSGKKVDIDWADRQFTLPGNVAHRVSHGISRNLVIRNCDPNLTEAALREDLEHIHNLVVITVRFTRGNCFISTNSIHNAMFARTCMMSRQKYKRSRVEWDNDECDVPLPLVPTVTRQPEPPAKKPLDPLANRFELLSFDDSDY